MTYHSVINWDGPHRAPSAAIWKTLPQRLDEALGAGELAKIAKQTNQCMYVYRHIYIYIHLYLSLSTHIDIYVYIYIYICIFGIHYYYYYNSYLLLIMFIIMCRGGCLQPCLSAPAPLRAGVCKTAVYRDACGVWLFSLKDEDKHQSYTSKGIRRQGIGSFVRDSYVSTPCPVVICPYLCTSERQTSTRHLRSS